MAASEATAPPQAPEAKPGGRKKVLVLVAVAVIVIAALGIGLVVLLGSLGPPASGTGLDHVTVTVAGGATSLDPSSSVSASATAVDTKGLDETANATFTWSANPSSSVSITHPGGSATAYLTGLLPGSVTLTATATWGGTSKSGTASLTVTRLVFVVGSNTAHPTIGSAFLLTVRVARPDNTTDANFDGVVHFTSTDPTAALPPDSLISPADAGVASYSNVIVNASGTTTITASNTTYGVTGSLAVTGNHAPVASFTVTGSSTNPAKVTLDASASSDPDAGETLSYFWMYGDGNLSQVTTAISTYTYARTGTFTITLTVSDNYGASSSVSHGYTVHTPPTASFKVDKEAMNGTSTGVEIKFNATASSGGDGTLTSYTWSFGDSSTATVTSAYVYHNYSLSYNGQSVTVRLTVTNNYTLTNQSSKLVPVSTTALPPEAAFTLTINNYTRTVSVDASGSGTPTGQAIVYYNWTWGDGSHFQNLTTPTATHTYASDNTFTIALTVVNTLNAVASTSHNAVVALVNVPPVAIFNYTKDQLTVTVNASASFDLNGNLAWFTWTWGDGSPAQTFPSSQETATHAYAAAGLYQITLVANDTTNLKGSTTRYVSVSTSTLDYTFYDFFNVPYGEWWDLRLAKYGDLPIGANCFNWQSKNDSICSITNSNLPVAESYPYTDWYPQPAGTGSNSWSHFGNDPLIYAPYRFNVIGVNQQAYNTSEPVFLPVLNYGAKPASTSYVNFNWSMQYLDMATANYVVNTMGCPLGSGPHFGDDGFMIRSQINLTLDEQEAARLFGAPTTSNSAYTSFWSSNSVPCNSAKGFPSTLESSVANWFNTMGNTKYDIYSSFQYTYTPFYVQISASVDPTTLTTHVHIDTSAWGTEVLLARMFYWGNASYELNYLNSAAARGWWGMELAWFEDFHFGGTLIPSGMDFHLNTAMEYHFNQLTAPGPDGTLRDAAHPSDTDDVPYWTWGPWLSDYIPGTKAHVSELTRYTSPYSSFTGYLHSTPGTGTWIYGVNSSYEFIPSSWAPKAGEQWHFVFPFGNVKFYSPNSPQPSNPVSNDYQVMSAPVAFWETRPRASGWGGDVEVWNQTAWSWDVFGSSTPPTTWPCGCANNQYPWMPYGAVIFLPQGKSTANPPEVASASTMSTLTYTAPTAPAAYSWSTTAVAIPDLLEAGRSYRGA